MNRCIGTSTAGHHGLTTDGVVKHRFAYKIRVENFSQDSDSVVQLLGRTWIIQEDVSKDENKRTNDESDGTVYVNAPTTGAVGHLPVIHPGEIFEYMSGCELSTETGAMNGCLHLAFVDPSTKSAQVGDPIETFHLPKEKHFEMPVAPFKLVAEKGNPN